MFIIRNLYNVSKWLFAREPNRIPATGSPNEVTRRDPGQQKHPNPCSATRYAREDGDPSAEYSALFGHGVEKLCRVMELVGARGFEPPTLRSRKGNSL